MISTGCWAGRRAFVVGGGSSLRGFDWTQLAGERWIGVNHAGLFGADVCLANDGRWVRRWGQDPRFHARTERLWLRTESEWRAPAPWRAIDYCEPQRWTATLEEGLINGPLTGLTAIHLADVLGANPIYLLGFDMHPAGGHFHDEYAAEDARTQANASDAFEHPGEAFKGHIEYFERWAPHVRATVFNLNLDSALPCFERTHGDRLLWNLRHGIEPMEECARAH